MRATGQLPAVAAGMALVLMAACAGTTRQGSGVSYAIPQVLDVTRLLSPPPADEAARARDLAAVHAAERARTPKQAAR
jgi:hypothetical protein